MAYKSPSSSLATYAIQSTAEIGDQAGTGDVLVFLTGREEIERCLEELAELLPT